jgi:hypothetical protein
VTSEHAATLLRRFLTERILRELAVSFPSSRPGLSAALAASQLVGLAVARYAVRLPPLAAADTEELVSSVAPVLQYYLTGHLTSLEES